MKILVRNLSRKTTEAQIRDLFEPFGKTDSCVLVMDSASGNSKGFGFVEMSVIPEAEAAIEALNGKVVDGATIRVKLSNN